MARAPACPDATGDAMEAPASDTHPLIRASVAGDTSAWSQLVGVIVPVLERMSRGHPDMRKRGLSQLDDDVAEVRTAVLERLSKNGFSNLQKYLARCDAQDVDAPPDAPPPPFDAWLYGAVDFAVREHVRRRYGRAPRASSASDRPMLSKRDLGTDAGRLPDQELARDLLSTMSATAKLTVAEILEHIARQFSPEEGRAIDMYFAQERSFDEIAAGLGLDGPAAAEKLIRRLNARLRYRFGSDGTRT